MSRRPPHQYPHSRGSYTRQACSAQRERWGIGSDSNSRIALSEALRTLDDRQRLRDHCRAALATAKKSNGRVLFETAARCGKAKN